MLKVSKNIMIWLASVIIMFSLCSPIIGYLTGLLIVSQNVNSLLSTVLIIVGIAICFIYLPTIIFGIKDLFYFFKY